MVQDARILDIDLSNKTYIIRILSSETYRKYPGGSALGMYFMLKETKPGIDPLSEENLLIFSVSPLTGLPISGQSRMTVTTKSPLTGAAGDTQVGGFIAAHVKANGYDCIIFRGKSEKPVYVYIDKDHIEFKDAKNIWGKVTGEAEDLIIKELGNEKIESSIIGPAGENMSKMANIIHRSSRANGRNGTGAVMGSKNLKALVVKRQSPIKAVDMNGLRTLTKDVRERITSNLGLLDMQENGTAGTVTVHQQDGFLPTKNWSTGILEGAEATYGTTITKTVLKEIDTCYACAIRCKRVVEIEGRVDPKYGGPEYETCATFGAYCGNTNLEDICFANQLCNMYGLDTISCGATIAFAMDCYENGLLTKEDIEGLELKFGNSSVFEILIPKMAYKEKGIGELLSDGSARAAEKIGKGSERLVVACKKQEAPAHMVQLKPNLAINYAVNPFGADHQSTEHDVVLMVAKDSEDWKRISMLGEFEGYSSYGVLDENKAKFQFEAQKFYSMLDTLCLCQFAWGPAWQLYGPKELIDFCKYGVDWDTSIEELQEIGERRLNMMRYFNAREGFTKKDDILPERMFIPMPEGPNKGVKINKEDFKLALEKYYEFAGWDKETGNPTKETLKRLDLDWVLDD